MPFGIVTGFTEDEHITPHNLKALNAAVAGSGNYVLKIGKQLQASMITANKLRVLDGYGMMGGAQYGMEPGEYIDLTVDNGTQGMNRVDLVVARYDRTGAKNIESVTLRVIKGTPSSSTPSVPSFVTGDILAGAATAEMPLYKVQLSGLTVAAPVAMFEVLTPSKEAWDSISRTFVDGWTVQKIGGITRYSKAVSKSFTFGAAGAVFASGTITEYFPGKVGAILGVSVSLCDAARDGWVGCTDAGSEGVNFKFFSWFNVGSPAARRFSICVDVTS